MPTNSQGTGARWIGRVACALCFAWITTTATGCLSDPDALDPSQSDSALLTWLLGYSALQFRLPECGFLTPAYRVANSGDLAGARRLQYSRNNLTYSYTLDYMLGCTPTSVANSSSGTSFALSYHPNRLIARREESNGKLLTSTLNAEGWVTGSRSECIGAGAIHYTSTIDTLNRTTLEASVDDAACSWSADSNEQEFTGLSRVPSRFKYFEGTSLYSDNANEFVVQDGLVVEQRSICLGGTTCSSYVFQFTYDGNRRLVTEQRTQPSTETTSYTYDADGRILTVTNPSSNVNYSYDSAGRMISVVESVGPLTLTLTY